MSQVPALDAFTSDEPPSSPFQRFLPCASEAAGMVIILLLDLVPRKHTTLISSTSPKSVSSSSAYEPQNTNGAGVEKPDMLTVCWDRLASTATKVQTKSKVAQGSFYSSQRSMHKRWTVILTVSPGVGIHMQLPRVQWDSFSRAQQVSSKCCPPEPHIETPQDTL